MSEEKRKRKTLVGDFIIIAAVLALALISALIVFLSRDRGAWCAVSVDGKALTAFPLSTDTVYEIPLEEGHNTLTIKDGKAYVSFADCPDKICANHKPIEFDGESIICLPHKVVISIEENEPRGYGDANDQQN